MRRFKNILLYAAAETGGNAVFERAASLAKRNQALLTVVKALERLPHEMQTQATLMNPAELQEIATQELTEQLELMIASFSRDEGVQVNAKVLYGTPFLEIIREVLRNQHDLVMMAAEGKAGLKAVIFGSTAMHLMRKCPCPVWVVKPTPRQQYARILAAVDPSPYDEERKPLNQKIMELATSLAELEGSELHVVHAWTQFAEQVLRGRRGLPEQQVDQIVRETRAEHKMWLDELLEKFPLENLRHRIHLLKGEAGRVIPEVAKRKRVELIIMGTVSRTGISGFLIGNTAEKVLQQVDCSVLTVKPEGFVTPIRLDEK